MPFSAHSPEGPISLLGADPVTVEALRLRSRGEACFTARCCGAPLTVRTAGGRAPHFVHKVVPTGCEGDRRETPEHERLKAAIAMAIQARREWQVDTEAIQRDAHARRVLWRADVLAVRGRARVAFEVQLSNADFAAMRLRQERYRASGVRGMWFVRTKKGFPASWELPVFRIDTTADTDRVSLATAWDAPFICEVPDAPAGLPLADFVVAALAGKLRWAPFQDAPETELRAWLDYAPADDCPGCGRTEIQPLCVRVRVAGASAYPEFQFAQIRGLRRSSGWYRPLVEAVWSEVPHDARLTLRTPGGACRRCGTPLTPGSGQYRPDLGSLAAALQLKDLPKPCPASVEHAWLQRWAVVERDLAAVAQTEAAGVLTSPSIPTETMETPP